MLQRYHTESVNIEFADIECYDPIKVDVHVNKSHEVKVTMDNCTLLLYEVKFLGDIMYNSSISV